jgi:kexin
MYLPAALILLLTPYLCTGAKTKLDWNTNDHFVIQHDPNGPASLTECCNALGVEPIEQVGELENHWLVRTPKHVQKRDEAHPVIDTLNYLRRHASGELQKRATSSETSFRIVNSIKMLEKQELRKRVKRELALPIERRQQGLVGGPISTYAQKFNIVDAICPSQWHHVNDQYPRHVMNDTGLWEMGITGKGVISAMVDDGLDYESEDLAENFVSLTIKFSTFSNLLGFYHRMHQALTTSTTMSLCPNPFCGMIITARAVLAKLLRSRMKSVESV